MENEDTLCPDAEALRLDRQLCFPLYAASREVIKQYYPFLEQLDLTYTQYVTMMVVWEEKRLTAGALGKRLFLDSGTLTPVLKKLAEKGLVTRCRSEDDERNLTVALTDEGRALRGKALDIPGRVGACIPLSAEDAAALYDILYRLLGML